jgi:hypothetical protein
MNYINGVPLESGRDCGTALFVRKPASQFIQGRTLKLDGKQKSCAGGALGCNHSRVVTGIYDCLIEDTEYLLSSSRRVTGHGCERITDI